MIPTHIITSDVSLDHLIEVYLLSYSTVKLGFLPFVIIKDLGEKYMMLCQYPVSPQTFAHWLCHLPVNLASHRSHCGMEILWFPHSF